MSYVDKMRTCPLSPEMRPGRHAGHLTAMQYGGMGQEVPIVKMLRGWLLYADIYAKTYEGTGIGEDGLLGDAWQDVGKALRVLLCGTIGRLDAGTVDALICNVLKEEGFNVE